MSLPRMRTATQLADEYRAKDPQTALSVYFLRRLISDGKVPFIKAGKKYLINADAVDAYLAAGQPADDRSTKSGIIRPIRA